MSYGEIERFNQAMREDSEMLDEFKALGTEVGSIIEFANHKGFNFTLKDVQEAQAASGELSEDDLENVAGGIVGIAIAQGVTVAGVVFLIG
ncbi:Nif11-like leader peptide family RiPP precursor [Fusibacter ferrireducens]|uniref:Nif11-like leader peptide family RiPP n=1 Tax=Fusibacter ferrireducens TaxID=2785058 RepID=A0ABR9ZQ64_9FIRM|nr:Nif11-like leader peptide family RiPP precursor [Fusibacter ferrireducens]MBF4692602.1 Nif11-like leader peptide family RiPP precursor [Fusibacter ferrireducens]